MMRYIYIVIVIFCGSFTMIISNEVLEPNVLDYIGTPEAPTDRKSQG